MTTETREKSTAAKMSKAPEII